LDVGAELPKHFIRLGSSPPELIAVKGADRRDFSLDYESAQCHGFLA
jgi:hypothetical protein